MKPVILNIPFNKDNLWSGCILASIAHAIMVAHYPELSYEHSWDGDNYSDVDDSGGRGTISFKNDYYVAAFRNENLTRTDHLPTALDFFTDAPTDVLELATNETLEYLLQEDEAGMVSPSITTCGRLTQKKLTSPTVPLWGIQSCRQQLHIFYKGMSV